MLFQTPFIIGASIDIIFIKKQLSLQLLQQLTGPLPIQSLVISLIVYFHRFF